ncbi:universal stress protein [Carbonactinospora thermoautotrophica]|uniref:universal stress protein n=1 Tax=Carbonactinospora thermoautotrophica TaxID=1469144 RepID=UPI00082A918E|nr:universal stress protein [Carbonactinospora thermoautotrophica]
MTQPIVVGLDGSAGDEDAIRQAAVEARARRRPVRLVHALEIPLPFRVEPDQRDRVRTALVAAVETMLGEAARRIAAAVPGVPITREVVSGGPVPALLERTVGAALLVLGSGKRFDPTRMWLGSVARHLVRHAACPVLVARRPAPGEPTEGPATGRIVVGVDCTSVSADAVAFAFEEAALRGTGLIALHAWEPWNRLDRPDLDEVARAEEARHLAEALAGWSEKYPDVAVERMVVRDRPVLALTRAAAGAELVVVGSHGRADMALGSAGQALLRHAPASIAIVRPRRHG